ncbi:MAG: TlpA disulfide reductase family protein [Pyrinomonadaceae bacterium]
MKQLFANLALFIVFCIVFSGLSACTGTQSNIANNSSAKPTTNANAQTNDGKTSAYPLLGTGLADAELEMLDGTKTKISDRKGKVVLVNIWGTWCGPCRAEMPFLIAMQDQYRDRGLEIMGLNIGDGSGTPESVEAIKKFVEQMKLNYTIVRSPNAATAQFYAVTKQQVVPQTLLIDREGHLRGVFIGGGQSISESIKTTLEKTMAE